MEVLVDPNLLRGNLDLIVLTILEHGPRYGLEIINEAKSRTDGYLDFKEGSLYPALHRLEKSKLVEAEFQPSPHGPRRRYYRVTTSGQRQLAEKRHEWERFSGAIEALWGKS